MTLPSADRCKVPQAFWRAVERAGLRPPAVLRQAGLPATLHLGAQGLVSTAQFFALWRAIADLSGDPAFGLRLVEATETAVHPPSTLAAFHARDYRDALHRLARFKRLCTPEVLRIDERDGTCTLWLEWVHAGEPEPPISVDVDFATLMELGRRGTGKPLVPLRVDLARPPHDAAPHAAYFRCPIRFDAPQNRLVLSSEDLDRPFPGHNPDLLDMLTPALASALEDLQASASIRERVKTVLKRGLASGRPDLAAVARDLGMSERSLQRRIADEGATFRDLVVEARQDLGRKLLSDPAADIDEVACLLGYQDTSSFYRAFRDWEGVTPNQWRERHGPASSPPPPRLH